MFERMARVMENTLTRGVFESAILNPGLPGQVAIRAAVFREVEAMNDAGTMVIRTIEIHCHNPDNLIPITEGDIILAVGIMYTLTAQLSDDSHVSIWRAQPYEP